MSRENMNVSSSTLKKEIQLCDQCLSVITKLGRNLRNSREEVQRLGWKDQNFKKAADRVDGCIQKINEDMVESLNILKETLRNMYEIVLRYENGEL